MSHTKRPWRCNGCSGRVIYDAENKLVADVDILANAAHIVRCVNSHDVLVEALEKIRNMTDGHPVDADRRDRINQLTRTALATIEEP